MLRKTILLIFIYLLYPVAFGQKNDTIINPDTIIVKIIKGDTILTSTVPPVYIYTPHEYTSEKELQKYTRLVWNVKKVYPYAILASEKLIEVNNELLKLKTKKEQKAYLDSTEVNLRNQFEDKLKQLTITQGRILIKLIDRETGQTTYALVKELKGSFQAFFWQTIARLFGSNLKSKYDPLGEDRDIEEIIIKIQRGQI